MKITIARIIELAFETSLAYFVFFISLASVPYAQAVWQQTAGIVQVFEVNNYIVIGETKVIVDVADSENARVKGLSGRSLLEPGSGLLFIFDEVDLHGIWMKEMNFSIDIIWIAENMQVIHIAENVAPDTFPTIFRPDRPARFVLEVPAGFVFENGIKNGDLLTVF